MRRIQPLPGCAHSVFSPRVARSAQYLFSAELPAFRGAGFQTCCVAGFQTRWPDPLTCAADLEVGDTADLEVCATLNRYSAQPRAESFHRVAIGKTNGNLPNIACYSIPPKTAGNPFHPHSGRISRIQDSSSAPRPDLAPNAALPEDTRPLGRPALQSACGGTRAGCAYDPDKISAALEAGSKKCK